MGCVKRFLNFQWEHHSWSQRVLLAETLPTRETNMWGRGVDSHYVRCRKQQTCRVCGQTRPEVNCICDPAQAEHCVIRRAWMASLP
jgi:hypothetical protein